MSKLNNLGIIFLRYVFIDTISPPPPPPPPPPAAQTAAVAKSPPRSMLWQPYVGPEAAASSLRAMSAERRAKHDAGPPRLDDQQLKAIKDEISASLQDPRVQATMEALSLFSPLMVIPGAAT